MKPIINVYFQAREQHPLGPQFQTTKYVADLLLEHLNEEQLQDIHNRLGRNLTTKTDDTTCLLGGHDVK